MGVLAIKAFGIFPGVARKDNLVAAAVYQLEDYAKYFGGGVEEYKDYLLSRHLFLAELFGESGPLRVVHVPFDAGEFLSWLEANKVWRDDPEGHSAWALDVAEDTATMLRLREKYPILPGVPLDERFVVEVFYVAVPLIVKTREDLALLGNKLAQENLTEVAEEFRELFEDVPAYERVSPLRCRGLRVAVGNRLIIPERVDDITEYLEELRQEEIGYLEEGGVVKIPRKYRARQSDLALDGKTNVFLPVFLPVVVAGANSEVRYADWVLRENSVLEEPVAGAAAKAVDAHVPDLRVREFELLLVPSHEVDMFLDELADMWADEPDGDGEGGHGVAGRKGNGRLRRVK